LHDEKEAMAEAKTRAQQAALRAVGAASAAWREGGLNMHALISQLAVAVDLRLHGALVLINRLSSQLPRLKQCDPGSTAMCPELHCAFGLAQRSV
jgi:hypothetical protein